MRNREGDDRAPIWLWENWGGISEVNGGGKNYINKIKMDFNHKIIKLGIF